MSTFFFTSENALFLVRYKDWRSTTWSVFVSFPSSRVTFFSSLFFNCEVWLCRSHERVLAFFPPSSHPEITRSSKRSFHAHARDQTQATSSDACVTFKETDGTPLLLVFLSNTGKRSLTSLIDLLIFRNSLSGCETHLEKYHCVHSMH